MKDIDPSRLIAALHAKNRADEEFLRVLSLYNLPYSPLSHEPNRGVVIKNGEKRRIREANSEIEEKNTKFLEQPITFYIAQFFYMAQVGGLKDKQKLLDVMQVLMRNLTMDEAHHIQTRWILR